MVGRRGGRRGGSRGERNRSVDIQEGGREGGREGERAESLVNVPDVSGRVELGQALLVLFLLLPVLHESPHVHILAQAVPLLEEGGREGGREGSRGVGCDERHAEQPIPPSSLPSLFIVFSPRPVTLAPFFLT